MRKKAALLNQMAFELRVEHWREGLGHKCANLTRISGLKHGKWLNKGNIFHCVTFSRQHRQNKLKTPLTFRDYDPFSLKVKNLTSRSGFYVALRAQRVLLNTSNTQAAS